jgi:hypothetical protein
MDNSLAAEINQEIERLKLRDDDLSDSSRELQILLLSELLAEEGEGQLK